MPKTSDLTALLAADVAQNDVLEIVDISDTATMSSPSGANKQITVANLSTAMFTNPTFSGNAVISTNNSNDALRITQTGGGNALVVEDSANPDSTPFVVDANGRVLSGYSTAQSPFAVTSRFQASSTDSEAGFSSFRYSADAQPGLIGFSKSRNASIGSQTIVQSGDELGTIRFAGSDGANFIQAASITTAVDGTPSTNDMPGRLVFSTTADGGTVPTERMRITSDGNVGIGTSTPTEKLDVTGNIKASQLLINNPSGDSRIEVGGAGNVYIDLKKPNSDDRDLRITTDGTDSIIDSTGGLSIATANNERMRITSAGNVGIGTASPSAKLHISGSVRIDDATHTTATAGSSGDVPAQVLGYLQINLNGTNVKIPYYAV